MILVKNTQTQKQIYEDMLTQFPQNELKTFTQYKKLCEREEYIIYNATENNEQVGYIIIVDNKELKYVWIDYLAVLKKFHSKGYGHKILAQLKNLYSNYNGCFLEVEKIDTKIPNTIRRVKFYESQGATKQPIDYYYPDYNEALPMDLYYFPYQEISPITNALKEIKFVFNILHTDLNNTNEIYNKIALFI